MSLQTSLCCLMASFERLIGNIDSEIVMQRGQNMSPELIAEVFIVVLGVFKGTSVNSQKNLSF